MPSVRFGGAAGGGGPGRERIVAAAMEPGAVTSAVAREAGTQASQLFRWRHNCVGMWLPGLHR